MNNFSLYQQVLGAEPWSAQTDAFRSGFLQGGGFKRVLAVAMAAPADGDRDVILGHASALRIIKTCLFYPPLQVLSTGGGVGSGNGAGGSSGGGVTVGGVGGGGRASGGRVLSGGAGGGTSGVGKVGAAAGANLVPRALPPLAPPSSAARAAMKVADADLQQLLDKLVLVSHSESDVHVVSTCDRCFFGCMFVCLLFCEEERFREENGFERAGEDFMGERDDKRVGESLSGLFLHRRHPT